MQQPPQNPYQPQAIYPHLQQEQLSYAPIPPQQMYEQGLAMPQPPMQPYAPQPPMMAQQPYFQPAPYPQQQMFQQPPMPQVMTQNVNVNVASGKQRGMLSRALYFVFIGWWLGFAWLNIGYFCVLTVVLLPVGLAMLNRLPQVLTLRPASATSTSVNVSTTMVSGMGGPVMVSNVNVNVGAVQQTSFIIRALYFCAIGWWAGYFWACTGYALVCFIVTMPLGLMMLNRLPAVLTLRKN